MLQFLDRENNEKKQYIAIGKTDLFYNSIGLCGVMLRANIIARKRNEYAWPVFSEVFQNAHLIMPAVTSFSSLNKTL